MRVGARIATYVGMLMVGGAVGVYTGLELASGHTTANEMSETIFYSTYVQTQRSEGNDAAYEEALRTYLKHLESRGGSEGGLVPARVRDFDSTLTYTRLSVLAS